MIEFNNGKFVNQTDLGWTFSFEANGKYPIIAKRIFETYAGMMAFIAGPTAIPGLILRVVADENESLRGAYLVETEGENLIANRMMTGDLDLKFEVVWAKETSPGVWVECPEGTPGAVQCLKLIHGESIIYIPLSKLVDLRDYAKIADVDASLLNLSNTLNDRIDQVQLDLIDRIMDVSTSLEDVSLRVDVNVKRIDDRISDLSTSLEESVLALSDWISGLEQHTEERMDGIDSSITEIKDILENDTVRTISVDTSTPFFEVVPVDSSHGDVVISVDASVIVHAVDSSDMEFEAHGLVTDAYVEERFSWNEV